MINLLPPEIKEEYTYALRNASLRRWVAAAVAALFGLVLLSTYGLATLQRSIDTLDSQVKISSDSLKQQHLSQTEAQVQSISDSFKLVVQVLSKEVLFSKLLKQIATVIPTNSVLTGLNISQTSPAIDLSAAASDYYTATQVQVNLQDPDNGVFAKADIVGINCQAAQGVQYPCTIRLRALFSANNPYLFINNKGS